MTTNISYKQPLRVCIAGPIGSGKTHLTNALGKRLGPTYHLAVATSGSPSPLQYPMPDQIEKEHPLPLPTLSAENNPGRNMPDASSGLALEEISALDLVLVEHAGNDLAAAFNAELVDVTIYVIDSIGGEALLSKGGTGLIHADLLIVNKIDLAPYLGIQPARLTAELRQQRGDRPFIFTDLLRDTGLDEIVHWLETYLLLPAEQRPTRQEHPALIEEQWFWRYKMSRGAHTHFDTTMRKKPLSAAPMSAAPLCYTDDGQIAWDQMWSDFCDLAAIGGPPHRGTLLEPVSPSEVRSDPEAYAQVVAEIERGIQLVTGLTTLYSPLPGWVGVECEDEMMTIWLQQAILAENVSVRRDGSRLYLPAGPAFQLKEEIKNIITVIAKTHHYWQEHLLWQRSKSAES